MKNHIKNYIKIMGLAAVPFGTAQAKDYEIKVTQEHKPDAEHFRISIGEVGKDPRVADIVWSHNKKYPNPIFEPNGFVEEFEDMRTFSKSPCRYYYYSERPPYPLCFEFPTMSNAWFNLLKWYSFYSNRLSAANWEYHVRKACKDLGLRIVSPGFAKKIKEFIGNDDESKRKKKLFCNFENAVVLDVTNRSFERFGGGVDKLPSTGKTHGIPLAETYYEDDYDGSNYVHYSYRLGENIPSRWSWCPPVPKRFDLFLIHSEEGWLLVVGGDQSKIDFVYVSSDVPTVCLNQCGGVYADNEEINGWERRSVLSAFRDTSRCLPILVTNNLVTTREYIEHVSDCDFNNSDTKEKVCTCPYLLWRERMEGVRIFPCVVLCCKDGKVTRAWFNRKLSTLSNCRISLCMW